MKKYILLALLPTVGMVNAEGNSTEKTEQSCYQDVKKFARLSSIQMDRLMQMQPETQDLLEKLLRLGSDIKSELEICEEAGNCEDSQQLQQMFRELSTVSLTLQNKGRELETSKEAEQINEIFKKYQQ